MLKLGDTFTLEVVYHDEPNSGVPHPDRPGVVRGPDGKLYVLDLLIKETT